MDDAARADPVSPPPLGPPTGAPVDLPPPSGHLLTPGNPAAASLPSPPDQRGRARPRRRAGAWIAGGAAAVLVTAALVAALVVTWSYVDSRVLLAQGRQVSAAERGVVEAAVAGASDVAVQISQRTGEYRDAAQSWAANVAEAEAWRAKDDDPTPQEPNPGGELPGGDAEERALLDAIGASEVQLLLEGGEQNCGYRPALQAGVIATGGCYRPGYRDWLFLGWDRGATADDLWPVFVHEAMHWYQWEHYAVEIYSAARAGVDDDAYGDVIETDASCRAVFVHGVPRWRYESSSSPCDVDDWYEGWIVDRIAALGAPVAAPDPEAYEVQPAVRP